MTSKQFEPLDALRNPIKLGTIYGYSSTSSGWSKTAVGKADKMTKTGMVTLSIKRVNHFLYGEPIERDHHEDAKTVNVRPHMLFPVSEENA